MTGEKQRLWLGIAFVGLLGTLGAQTPTEALRFGNQFFDEGDLSYAEKAYRRGLLQAAQGDTAYRLQHNLGNTVFNQAETMDALAQAGRFGEAATVFEQAAKTTNDAQKAANAWYNAGNAWQKRADVLGDDADKRNAFQQSIKAYQQALRRNPADREAQNNLALAQQKFKKLKPPPPPPGSPPPPKPENQPPTPPPPPQQPEAQRLLKILESEERATQGKVTRKNSPPPLNGKDW